MQNGLDDAYAHVRKALAAIERCVLDQPCELREQLDDASRFLTKAEYRISAALRGAIHPERG
jgi:hypothetical protein